MRISLKIFAIFLVFFAQKSFAGDYVSTNDVVKEIEKTLREKIRKEIQA